MSNGYHIVVCAGIVPDPLQTLEPVIGQTGPGLKNEMMLPAVLDPWASHALYEAANLVAHNLATKIWLVCAAPKSKLQQVMMNVAQKATFELVAVDVPANGFSDAHGVAKLLVDAIQSIAGIDRSRMLLFGGWESASRGTGVTMQLVGEQLGIVDQFQGVDQITIRSDGSLDVLERIEGGRHLASLCQGPPALLGWATGNLPEPRNNPQIGMSNMRTIIPALQKAKAGTPAQNIRFVSVAPPKQQRQTRIVKDRPAEEIAAEIAEWIAQG